MHVCVPNLLTFLFFHSSFTMNKFPGKYLYSFPMFLVILQSKHIKDQSQGLRKKEKCHGTWEQLAFLGSLLSSSVTKLNYLAQSRDLSPWAGVGASLWDPNI